MQMNGREIAKGLIPPYVLRGGRMLLAKFRAPSFYLRGEITPIPNSEPWHSPWWLSMSERKLNDTLLPRREHGYLDVVACFLNTSQRERLVVLDWGGGAGFVYFSLRDRLTLPVLWLVADNLRSAELGRDFEQSHSSKSGRIEFVGNELPSHLRYDVLLINTSLQYVEDGLDILEHLARKGCVRHVVLTRLLSCERATIKAYQVLAKGFGTHCYFHSRQELVTRLEGAGYRLVSDLENFADNAQLSPTFSPALRARLGSTPSRDLFFSRPADVNAAYQSDPGSGGS